jgi:hypothetical protein
MDFKSFAISMDDDQTCCHGVVGAKCKFSLHCLVPEYCDWCPQILGVVFTDRPLLDHPEKDVVLSRARMKKLIIF